MPELHITGDERGIKGGDNFKCMRMTRWQENKVGGGDKGFPGDKHIRQQAHEQAEETGEWA